jgi:hypothetical protein
MKTFRLSNKVDLKDLREGVLILQTHTNPEMDSIRVAMEAEEEEVEEILTLIRVLRILLIVVVEAPEEVRGLRIIIHRNQSLKIMRMQILTRQALTSNPSLRFLQALKTTTLSLLGQAPKNQVVTLVFLTTLPLRIAPDV